MWLINLLGLGLIGAIVWWFWLYKPRQHAGAKGGVVTIVVDNGVYQPAHIRLPAHRPATLRFIRKDDSPCAATVVFADLDISEELPLNRPKEVVLPPQPPGRYAFTCQMQMYRGELTVAEE